MNIRISLSAAALIAAASAFGQVSFGQAEKFNKGWRFSLSADSTASAEGFDDSQWRVLDLPHDWSVEAVPSPSLASATGYLPGGIGWYRRHFEVTDTLPKHYIYFEGAYNRSEVYLNGHLLGKRPNGYISFMYDMTPYLKKGENVLAVKLDHSRYADSRWYTGSGIYRDVYLIAAPDTHIAQWGVGYKALKITPSKARVKVDVAVENPVKDLAITAEVRDKAGHIVATAQKKHATKSNDLMLGIKFPHRWNLDDPYLYTLEVKLLRNGKTIDSTTTYMGLRELEFSPDHGFALNGRNMKVKGVCLHHDAGVLGAVVPEQVWERRLRNLKAVGVNAIRMSHNPQAPVLYDLCDRMGLLVMDEASDEWEFPKRKWVEGWNVGTPSFEGSYDFFEEWIERDVADMVRRDRNHPSVAFWSIGNEVDYPNDPYSHPVLDSVGINQPNFGGYDSKAPRAERIGEIAKRLAAVVRKIDDSRPVTGALAGVVMSNRTAYPEAVDIVGYNYTEDRYAEDHKTYPDRVIYGSENGQGYDQWLSVRDNPYIFGQFLWTGTDYLGEAGRWPSRGLGTGLLDFGSFPKQRGLFRASLWLDSPVAYLGTYPRHEGTDPGLRIDSSRVWNYDENRPVRVVCYTNAASARLLLDGKEYGPLTQRDDSKGIIAWDLEFHPGLLEVEAFDETDAKVADDRIATTGRPYALRAAMEEKELTKERPIGHVVVEITDDAGNMVPLSDNMVDCRVSGPVRILGVEGTGNHDMTHPKLHRRRVSGGRLLVYLELDPEGNFAKPAELTLTSPLLRSAKLSIPVKQ